jgi:hypothetical protein
LEQTVYLVSMAGGFLIGPVVGRWWAVLAGIAFGGWIGVTTSVDEVPHWLLGLLYGVLAVGGIILGLAGASRIPIPYRIVVGVVGQARWL